MKVKFWGVRGSIPVPGPDTIRYGGNTSCVEVVPGDGTTLIIDAGTGIRKLGKQLMRGASGRGEGDIHLLISHTHWDHIQGLPFFAPLYRSGNRITLYAREQDDKHLDMVLRSATEDPYFPVPFDAAQATVSFRELREGDSFGVGACQVRCARLNHPWIALGYRIQDGDRAVAYVSDTAPFVDLILERDFIAAPPRPGESPSEEDQAKLAKMEIDLVELCRGCQFVVFDTMFSLAEYRQRPHWGHSAPEHAVEILRRAGVGRLALYHHGPTRTDAQMDEVVAEARRNAPDMEIVGAAELTEFEV
ncbi:MAG: MBL fold metallo-hydrolase [Polyangia bacterium]|jgi:phosphoribosyl 1,2-cyclic phosphodiesterase|nr:MBL fold metallo-hydrolase [Polyangia bacterium]